MKKTAMFASLALAAGLASLPSVVLSAPWQAKQRQMKTNDEYQAYLAMFNEKEPNKKISLAEAFIQKFADSDYKDMAYLQEMGAYQQLGKVAEALDAGHKALDIYADNFDVINLEATLVPYYTYKPGDSAATQMLSRAQADIKHGLDLLAKLQKPANLKQEDFDKAVKSARASMNTALGYVGLQNKDNASAITYLQAATGDNPEDNLAFWLLGQADLAQATTSSAADDYDNAIWNLARASALAQAQNSPNAQNQAKFYDQVYVSRHGSDEGEKDVLELAKASVTPPAGFKVAPREKHKPTGNQVVDAFYGMEDSLMVGGAQEKDYWNQLKGQQFACVGQVDRVEKGTDADSSLIHIDITEESKAKEGTYDITLKDKQPDAKYLEKGDSIHLQGTISDYSKTPTFSLTLEGTVDNDVLAGLTADRKKGKARTTPRKKPG